MTGITIISSLIAVILLVWFRTDAFLEYTRLFRADCLSHYKDFDVKLKEDIMLTYIQYLRQYHNCFFNRLITCPICQAVWWALIFGIITSPFLIPVYALWGLILFLIVDKLLG